MIKDILANLETNPTRDAARDYAISAASLFEARLTGVAFAYEPVNPGTIFDGIGAPVIAEYREELRAAARAARDQFKRATQQANLQSEAHVIDLGRAGVATTFGEMARNFDLSIIGQARPDSEALTNVIIEGALFGSGRPVLVVPYIQKTGLKLDRVMVCWDGSRNAARAVADAMPLLRRAGAIEVVTIDTVERRNEVAGASIAEHLARHGLKIELKSITDKANDVASTILNHVADSCADFVVMGGYGHSRLREFVLGGATRGMLRSMTVPTLMAH
ncbi:MAG TPA: universal stress protein [Mesorhizobium sp.]|nr:universal stress protein [Mesorhizobium sp.]